MRQKISELVERPLDDLRIAVHYGCHYLYSHQNKVLDSSEHPKFLDEIVSTLGGTSIDYEEKDLCCGEPALRSIRNLSFELARRKILSIFEEEPDLILVMCPSCLRAIDKIQFEMLSFEEIDVQIPVVHISQLIGLAFGLDPRKELGLNLHLSSRDLDQSPLRKILSER
jgi:heterodisulfide reductase subunit B